MARLLRALPDLLEGPRLILTIHMGQLTNFLSCQEMPCMSLGVRHRWVSKTELCFCSDESDTNQGLQANTDDLGERFWRLMSSWVQVGVPKPNQKGQTLNAA